jgi:2',3'-cyclic-nucleotide 2'-phosphodiesterase/3'-nucleotidase/5'-nucleotidase
MAINLDITPDRDDLPADSGLILLESSGPGSGAKTTATGIVSRTGITVQPLTVILQSSDISELSVTQFVTIPAGQTSAQFQIVANNDAVVDGSQFVEITAIAAGMVDTAEVRVDDNDFIQLLGTYQPTNPGVFDEGAAEIVAYNPNNESLYVVNGDTDAIDILDISDPSNPTFVSSFSVQNPDGSPNSVAVKGDFVAVAVADDPATNNGSVEIFDADGNFLISYEVGALPDMVTFSPDGNYILSANEGEPNGIDPAGSISIIDISNGLAGANIETADFTAFDGMEDMLRGSSVKEGVRIFPGKMVSEDVEPEYITFSAQGDKAYVSLQEANSLAVVDLITATVTDILPLGVKDHSLPGNGLDASDRDDEINITHYPIYGMFMPDSIATIPFGGETFIVTANEGDDRGEDERVKDLDLDPADFPNATDLQEDENLGRLNVSTIDGDPDGNDEYDELFSYGTRSFSIFDASGNLVFDSGDDFEQITAAYFPEDFNTDNSENDPESRSDAKGPEPEALAVGQIGFRYYAFVGLERIGGVMVYDVTNPMDASFVQYINPRNFDAEPEDDFPDAGDLGPEGFKFIPAEDSPNGMPLLVAANEISGSTSVYQLNLPGSEVLPTPSPAPGNILGTNRNDFLQGSAF